MDLALYNLGMKDEYQIIGFEPKYEKEVREVIGKILKEIGVLPNLEGPLDDDDLGKIPEIYSGRGGFWLAIKEGRVIGTVAIRDMGEDMAKLNRMFVLAEFRGTGVGQFLFDHALKHARTQEFKKLVLNTHLLMSRAHRFYEKNGFVRVRQDEDKYYYEFEML